MTTLADVMLDVARLIGIVREGTATGGTTTTIVDTSLKEHSGYYEDGTLWMLSGDNIGACERVALYYPGTITIAAQTNACSAGDAYAVATGEYFQKHKLKQAVLSVLQTILIPSLDESHTATDGKCTLTNISNIRRVIVDGTVNYNWRELSGKIYFDDDNISGDLELWYLSEHPRIDEDEDIDNSISRKYLSWLAVTWLWRNIIQLGHKDNPISMDMLNEAKVNEQLAAQEARKHTMRCMPRDPHYKYLG